MPETIENQQSKNSSEVCLHTTLSLGGLVDMLEAIPPVLTSTTNYATCKKNCDAMMSKALKMPTVQHFFGHLATNKNTQIW